jgi:hypothetical protein
MEEVSLTLLGLVFAQDLLREVRRRGNVDLRGSGVLEFQDTAGFTPLVVAAARGNLNCVILVRFELSEVERINIRTLICTVGGIGYGLICPVTLCSCCKMERT